MPSEKRHSHQATAKNILDVLIEAPRLVDYIGGEPLQALASTCKLLRRWFCQRVTVVTVIKESNATVMQSETWPELVLAVVPKSVDDNSSDLSNSFKDWRWQMVFYGVDVLGRSTSAIVLTPRAPLTATTVSQQCQDALQRYFRQHRSTMSNLSLSGLEVDALAIRLLNDGSWPVLERVGLAGPRLDQEAMQHAANGSWPCVTFLHLHGTLNEQAVQYLGAGNLSSVKRLRISKLDTDGVKALGNGMWPHVKFLDLKDASLDTVGFEYLSGGPWKFLTCLKLMHVQINAAAATCLAKADWPELCELIVTHKHVQKAAYEVLGAQNLAQQLEGLEQEVASCRNMVTFKFEFKVFRACDICWPKLKHLTVLYLEQADEMLC